MDRCGASGRFTLYKHAMKTAHRGSPGLGVSFSTPSISLEVLKTGPLGEKSCNVKTFAMAIGTEDIRISEISMSSSSGGGEGAGVFEWHAPGSARLMERDGFPSYTPVAFHVAGLL